MFDLDAARGRWRALLAAGTVLIALLALAAVGVRASAADPQGAPHVPTTPGAPPVPTTPGASTTPTPSTTPTTPGPPPPLTAASNARQLALRMNAALQSVSSAHLTVRYRIDGQVISGAGDETFSSGKLDAMKLAERIPRVGLATFLLIKKTSYAKLPNSVFPSVKGAPWVRLRTSSMDQLIRQLAKSFASTEQESSVDSFANAAGVAESFVPLGRARVGGRPAEHYRIMESVAKLAALDPKVKPLLHAGVTEIPVQLWLDQQNRIIKFQENVTAQGDSEFVTATVSRYNAPLQITAPPPNEVTSP